MTALRVKTAGRYIDCTVGEGGHAEAILGAVGKNPSLLGIDLDTEALSSAKRRLEIHGKRVRLIQGSFANVERLASEWGFVDANGILLDLGLSSLQLQKAERGFSFSKAGPLDMRFDATQELTAHRVVNEYTERQLAEIIFRFGEERTSRRLAKAIVQARPLESTIELANAIVRVTGQRHRSSIHPATRTFQAIRIAVNRELQSLQSGLEQAVRIMSPGGWLTVISYHSLEDRLVKRFLQREGSSCICPPRTPECICDHRASIRMITRRVVRPSLDEVRTNPSSRSARLRVAERLPTMGIGIQ